MQPDTQLAIADEGYGGTPPTRYTYAPPAPPIRLTVESPAPRTVDGLEHGDELTIGTIAAGALEEPAELEPVPTTKGTTRAELAARIATPRKRGEPHRCARCGRALRDEHYIYSTHTRGRYCWTGEGCNR